MKCKCGANLYRISGLTKYDNRDGIREAAWCDSCHTLFSSHAFGLSEIGKLTDGTKYSFMNRNNIDHIRARNELLEAANKELQTVYEDEIETLELSNAESSEVAERYAGRILELEAEVERLRKAAEWAVKYMHHFLTLGGQQEVDPNDPDLIDSEPYESYMKLKAALEASDET